MHNTLGLEPNLIEQENDFLMNKIVIIISLAVTVSLMFFPFLLFYGNEIMVITSTSMIPVLNPNDLITVKKIDIDQIQKNDIIVFDSHTETGNIAHRAIKIDQEEGKIVIVTKGDNVITKDPWLVSDEDLIGKVNEIIPYLGIFLVASVRYTLVAIIIIIAIFLLKESVESKTQSKTES